MIDMQKRSRIQGGIAYRKRFGSQKLQKCVRLLLFGYVGLFIAIEIALMLLTLFKLIDETTFYIQLVSLVGLLVVVLNIWAFVQYCSNAGSPYRNKKDEIKAIWVGRVAMLWSLAIVAKLIVLWYDPEVFDPEK